MASITFDTLKLVKRLKAAGFEESQAEALSEAFKETQETSLGDLATKQELKELRLEMQGEFRLLKWMIGVMFAGVVSLVLKAFFIP